MEEAQDMKQRLEAYLRAKFPQREELSIVKLERVTGGMSYETSLFTVSWREAQGPVSEGLVLRMEPEYGCVPPYDVRFEYEILKRVYGTGVPVAKVHWLEMDSKVLGRPFFIMEKVEGEILDSAYRNHPEYQTQLKKDYVSVLAKIHGLDWPALGLSILGTPENDHQYAEKDIARWERVVEDNQYSPQPVMAELFTWLKRNVPRAERTTLCHGDFKSMNFITRNGRIVATLDWELGGIGDPISDLGFFSFLISMQIHAGGYQTVAEFIRNYEEITGVKVNEESLFFWTILWLVKCAAIGYAGIKAGIELKKLDMRQLSYTRSVLTWQDTAARMLGF